jgi:hypothetical protein
VVANKEPRNLEPFMLHLLKNDDIGLPIKSTSPS